MNNRGRGRGRLSEKKVRFEMDEPKEGPPSGPEEAPKSGGAEKEPQLGGPVKAPQPQGPAKEAQPGPSKGVQSGPAIEAQSGPEKEAPAGPEKEAEAEPAPEPERKIRLRTPLELLEEICGNGKAQVTFKAKLWVPERSRFLSRIRIISLKGTLFEGEGLGRSQAEAEDAAIRDVLNKVCGMAHRLLVPAPEEEEEVVVDGGLPAPPPSPASSEVGSSGVQEADVQGQVQLPPVALEQKVEEPKAVGVVDGVPDESGGSTGGKDEGFGGRNDGVVPSQEEKAVGGEDGLAPGTEDGGVVGGPAEGTVGAPEGSSVEGSAGGAIAEKDEGAVEALEGGVVEAPKKEVVEAPEEGIVEAPKEGGLRRSQAEAKGVVRVEVEGAVGVEAEGAVEVEAEGAVGVEAEGAVEVEAEGAVGVEAEGAVEVEAEGAVRGPAKEAIGGQTEGAVGGEDQVAVAKKDEGAIGGQDNESNGKAGPEGQLLVATKEGRLSITLNLPDSFTQGGNAISFPLTAPIQPPQALTLEEKVKIVQSWTGEKALQLKNMKSAMIFTLKDAMEFTTQLLDEQNLRLDSAVFPEDATSNTLFSVIMQVSPSPPSSEEGQREEPAINQPPGLHLMQSGVAGTVKLAEREAARLFLLMIRTMLHSN